MSNGRPGEALISCKGLASPARGCPVRGRGSPREAGRCAHAARVHLRQVGGQLAPLLASRGAFSDDAIERFAASLFGLVGLAFAAKAAGF